MGKVRAGERVDQADEQAYDYAVCNGILTQNLDVPDNDMDAFMGLLVQKMFSICRVGIAFNLMSSEVNYRADNLFYKRPIETLSQCLKLTRHVVVDHGYGLYEYTVYCFKESGR